MGNGIDFPCLGHTMFLLITEPHADTQEKTGGGIHGDAVRIPRTRYSGNLRAQEAEDPIF